MTERIEGGPASVICDPASKPETGSGSMAAEKSRNNAHIPPRG